MTLAAPTKVAAEIDDSPARCARTLARSAASLSPCTIATRAEESMITRKPMLVVPESLRPGTIIDHLPGSATFDDAVDLITLRGAAGGRLQSGRPLPCRAVCLRVLDVECDAAQKASAYVMVSAPYSEVLPNA
ncbi:hypothetical protein ASD30_13530 [Nocardioides sp. Root140]|nr:hypothetical protein ASD30_13530 [Nocardioides sp. Root140]KRF11897.1 hypothetical protein ASH02_18205 [Nocardioides sp. Soil796]